MEKAPQLKIAVCEMTSDDNWSANQKQILDKLKALEGSQVDFVSFPENSLYLRVSEWKPFETISLEDRIFDSIHEYSKRLSCLIHLGSVPLKDPDGQAFNSTVLLYPDGKRTVAYKKMHLFDVDIAGDRSYRESDLYRHGSGPQIFEWRGWKFGASICYDLRFSELYQVYGRNQVDVILIPAAFTVPTGEAHWSVLLRARAIENQCYVVAAAQQGRHGEKRSTYGHSMIVGPWGDVIADAKPGETVQASLEQQKILAVRTQIPMSRHRHDVTKFKLS